MHSAEDTAFDRPPVRRWGTILWPSFVFAGIATMVFFAFVDPLDLAAISFPGREFGREFGYTIGFFMFWAVTAGSSAMTWLLLRPASAVHRSASTRGTQ